MVLFYSSSCPFLNYWWQCKGQYKHIKSNAPIHPIYTHLVMPNLILTWWTCVIFFWTGSFDVGISFQCNPSSNYGLIGPRHCTRPTRHIKTSFKYAANQFGTWALGRSDPAHCHPYRRGGNILVSLNQIRVRLIFEGYESRLPIRTPESQLEFQESGCVSLSQFGGLHHTYERLNPSLSPSPTRLLLGYVNPELPSWAWVELAGQARNSFYG